MDGSKKSDTPIPRERSSELVVPGADDQLSPSDVYSIFLNFMRSLLSNATLEMSFKYVPHFLVQCIFIDSGNDILSRIHIKGGGDIRNIKLFGYYNGAPYVSPRLASIHFYLKENAGEKVIQDNTSTLIKELTEQIELKEQIELQEQSERKESTSSKSPSDISELIGLLRDIKERCDEAIEKHGRG
jgi:hypothetical protein